jgi:hypothetical protein
VGPVAPQQQQQPQVFQLGQLSNADILAAISNMAASFNDKLDGVALRLNALETTTGRLGPLEIQVQQLAERMQEFENRGATMAVDGGDNASIASGSFRAADAGGLPPHGRFAVFQMHNSRAILLFGDL